MNKRKARGSIVYEIIIVILAIVLVATILYPKKVWKQIEHDTIVCRDRMSRILDMENLYISFSDAHLYDSSLVKIVDFVRNDSIFSLDSTRQVLRDTLYAKMILDYLRDYQDMATKKASDSAYTLVENRSDSLVATKIDSILDFMFSKIYTCPTDGDTYRITIIDTSAIKVLKIACPLDSAEVDSINRDFWFGFLGGGKVKNHGMIDNGEPKWEPIKRK